MIELKSNSGTDVILSPINKRDNIYELVDMNNQVHLVVELNNSSFKVIDNIDISEPANDLEEKLNILAISILEEMQSEVEQNEFNFEYSISPYNPDEIRVHQKQFSIKFIQEMIENQDIDFTPDFQRNFVWNSVQKSKLIESLLLRIPLPIFYFAEDLEGRLTIVDGLQRLTTIKEFMNNEFPLTHLEYLEEGVKGRYYKSDSKTGKIGIDPKYYRWFNMTQFAVNVIDPSSPYKVKYDIFRRINTGGRPLRNQEIRNCLSSPKLRILLKKMSKLPEFLLATNKSVKDTRMEDKEISLRFIAFYDAYFPERSLKSSYDGYMEAFLDAATDAYSKISEEATEKYIRLFSNAMKNAHYLLGSKYAFRKIKREHISDGSRQQLFNKALFVAWAVLLSELPNEIIIKTYPEKYLLEPFADLLESDKDLMFYLSYGTNGKANLEYIFESISKLLNEKIKLC